LDDVSKGGDKPLPYNTRIELTEIVGAGFTPALHEEEKGRRLPAGRVEN
jgi:hypothetical protein